jgi:chorismate dehydratase
MIKISAVSYANTYPFLLGLEKYYAGKDIIIRKDVPSECARKLIEGEVDLGLIPVAAIPFVPNAQIVSDFCIGSIGKVKTVLLMSKIPLDAIDTIYLDPESKSSITLIQVLNTFFYKKNWNFETLPMDYATSDKVNSMVLIGDKTQQDLPFPFVYDLSEQWMKFTQLPFVFAAWVANKPLNDDFILRFNQSLKMGLSNISEAIDVYNHSHTYNLEEYLTQYISYNLDSKKHKAIEHFLNLAKQLK